MTNTVKSLPTDSCATRGGVENSRPHRTASTLGESTTLQTPRWPWRPRPHATAPRASAATTWAPQAAVTGPQAVMTSAMSKNAALSTSAARHGVVPSSASFGALMRRAAARAAHARPVRLVRKTRARAVPSCWCRPAGQTRVGAAGACLSRTAQSQRSKIYLLLEFPPELACKSCLLYTSPSPRDQRGSRMPSSA